MHSDEIYDKNFKKEIILGKGINPLDIPSILGHGVMQYLRVEDLLTSRLVCKLWAQEGMKMLAKIGQFSLTEGDTILEFLEHFMNFEQNNTANLSSLPSLNLKLTTSSIPSFELCDKPYEQIEQLLQKIGMKIQFLQLKSSEYFSEDFWKMLFLYASNIKSLSLIHVPCSRELSISFLKDSSVRFDKIKHFSLIYENCQPDREYNNAMQTFIVQMFKVIPNLKKFSCNNKRCSDAILNELINTPDIHNINPRLSHLDIALNLNEEEVTKFHDVLKYPLEFLKFSLRPGLRFPGLYPFISALGPTLKTLNLDFILLPTTTEKFPCGRDLVNLKELSFKNYYGSLDFIHKTEKLETLSLTNVNLSLAFREELDFDFDTPHKLKTLEIFSGHSNAGRFSFPHIFQKMSKLFPKLKKFRMDYLSDSTLKIITAGCSELEELILVKAVCTDAGVTGLPSSICNNLVLTLNDSNEAHADIPERQPSIATLKHLRKLHIQSPKISNVSLWFGINSCKELQELCLSTPLINENILKSMAKKMQLHSLQLHECYQITPSCLNVLIDILKCTSGHSLTTCSMMPCKTCNIQDCD